MRLHYLSKSRFMAGMQCPKRLYLTVYPPDMPEGEDTGESLPILNGDAVGEMACKLYPGVMVEYDQGLSAAIRETARLVADEHVQRIHEATFSFDNILVRVDLLERTDAGWILTEVKAATSVKDYYLDDAAVQAWVLKGCGLKLTAVHLMHVNNQFTHQGDGNYDDLLHAEDITRAVNARLKGIGKQKNAFMQMLAGDMPDIAMGEQCYSPYECDFCAYCQPDDLPEYPISILPRSSEQHQQTLQDAGYKDVREIPAGVLENTNHQRVWRATCAGKEEVNVDEAVVLKELPWPRYYLDFETIALAVPRWKGVRPYMQIPFQWSCHVHHKDGRMGHVEFLDVTGDDPRRACAEGLVNHIGDTGVLIAYNAGFEKRVIRELAGMYPDLSETLLDMNERFFDLLPLTRAAYYHPSQMGSWSIKAVLPALVPEMSYADLEEVHDGSDAQLAWMKAADATPQERRIIAKQLLEYCKLDTLAMVKIVDTLIKKSQDRGVGILGSKTCKEFIESQIWSLSIAAAFQVRGRNSEPIYDRNVSDKERNEFRSELHKTILKQAKNVKTGMKDEHFFRLLCNTQDKIHSMVIDNSTAKDILHNGEFRLGVLQKLFNLYLKYEWCLGWRGEPPHCPFDRIVLGNLKMSGAPWTRMNNPETYMKWVTAAHEKIKLLGYDSIAVWELHIWNEWLKKSR